MKVLLLMSGDYNKNKNVIHEKLFASPLSPCAMKTLRTRAFPDTQFSHKIGEFMVLCLSLCWELGRREGISGRAFSPSDGGEWAKITLMISELG
jgi:hypothetical protein